MKAVLSTREKFSPVSNSNGFSRESRGCAPRSLRRRSIYVGVTQIPSFVSETEFNQWIREGHTEKEYVERQVLRRKATPSRCVLGKQEARHWGFRFVVGKRSQTMGSRRHRRRSDCRLWTRWNGSGSRNCKTWRFCRPDRSAFLPRCVHRCLFQEKPYRL